MQRQLISVTLIALLAVVSGCNQQPDAVATAVVTPATTTPLANANHFKPSATLQEIMLSVIDPNIDLFGILFQQKLLLKEQLKNVLKQMRNGPPCAITRLVCEKCLTYW